LHGNRSTISEDQQERNIMKLRSRAAAAFLLGVMTCLPARAAIPPADIPAGFVPLAPKTDFILRELMIPMRDGVKLHTIIAMPKITSGAPILLTRTPYGIDGAFKANARSITELLSGMNRELSQAGYILVAQDIRGRYGSEGDYRLLRPKAGTPLNTTRVDESTDAWDTIDWLVKNVPQSNGRIGVFGGSYGGFTTLMAEMNPHPALKAAVPFNSVVDVWTGDDLFHHGAFRQTYLDWVFSLVSDKDSALPWPEPRYDAYETWLAGSAGAVASAQGMDSLPYWQRVIEHPAYDNYWQDQAVDRLLKDTPLTVPTLSIHSQWDQEDIYGPIAAYRALEAKDKANDLNFLVIGPWKHGGGVGNGSELGAIKFGSDTGYAFRHDVMIPFLDRYLKDGAPKVTIAPVTAFETGTNVWRHYDSWPQSCAQGCAATSQALYLQPGKTLAFVAPAAGGAAYDEYISDPAKPVTYRLPPFRPTYASDSTWGRWLVDDQRFAAARPDVLTYTSPVLTAPVHIAGQTIAHLIASTSGRDSDWVVKLIDVYPDVYPAQPDLGGYELPITMDIMRGRYRDDPAKPTPIPSNVATKFTLLLPYADHVFLPGHRIMVQIQSSWFPLYDRNPQSWVDNIFLAKPADYVKATQRVFHAPGQASYVKLPVVP
jgi:putative CocE/NonD family hydrolase